MCDALENQRDRGSDALERIEILDRVQRAFAHDLRGALNAALLQLALARAETERPSTGPDRKRIETIESHVRDAHRMIEAWTAISRAPDPAEVACDLRQALEQVLDVIRPVLRAGGCEIAATAGPALVVRAQPQRLRQALLKLLLEPSSPAKSIRVSADSEGDDATVRCSIDDAKPEAIARFPLARR